ncbi:Ig-like domain-containing protein, partial [Leucobacter luti]|uniref:Ig-like domain-containing protein n=1 Tax=Leucobacter luti TaxID=340320 RepID=UPI00102B0D18
MTRSQLRAKGSRSIGLRLAGVQTGGRRAVTLGLAFLVALTAMLGYGPLLAPTPAQAAGHVQGEVVGHATWPADADLHAGGVWGGGDMNRIIGTKGTPTEAIFRQNTNAQGQPTGSRNSINLGVSAHVTNPGIWATPGLNLGTRSAASPEVAAHYGFQFSVEVDWTPATDNGVGEKGKVYTIEIPVPTTAEATAAGKPIYRNFNNSSCGMEVNPYTSAIVILNNCTANENNVQYLVLNPGPDGDPLTLEDNSFDWFVASPPTVNGGAVSDMTIDALGNVYNFLSPAVGSGRIVRTSAATGEVTEVGAWNQAPTEATGIYEWVSLGFENGKMVVPTGNVNTGQKLFAVDPLTGKAEAVDGYTPGLLNRQYVNYDGAGVEGAIGLEGKVVDTNGAGVAGQTIGIYQDNGDGTATLQGSRTTAADGSYAAMLNWSHGVGYVRVVQPALTTGAGAAAQVKNGEVVAITADTAINDGTNLIETMNERNNGINPALGTPLTTTIDVADTDDLVKITGNNASVFYTADFTVKYEGSTADLSRNSLLTTNATTGVGPQHVTIEDDAETELRLGATSGARVVGGTDGAETTNDGVFLNLAGDSPLAANQLFAKGLSYPLLAESQGAQADNAQVTAWISAAGAQNANPRGAFGPGVSGTGAAAELELGFPNTAGYSTLRVNSSLDAVTKPDNTDGEYAATATTADTRPWTTSGEVEDYDVRTVDTVLRVSADSTVPGTYAYSMTGVTGTAPSTTSESITVTEPGVITPSAGVHEGVLGQDVVLTTSAAPTGAVLRSAEVIDSFTGAHIADATVGGTAPATTITVPSSAMPSGSDARLILTYSELPSADTSTLTLAPATATADGTAEIVATVTVLGSVTGAPLAGETVTIAADPANADLTVSTVTDNGDGTYTAVLTSSVAGTYPVAGTVEIGGVATEVSGSPADAEFTAGAPSAAQSSWEIALPGPLPSGTGAASTYTATATIRDAQGNAVGAGVDVVFTVPAGVNGSAAANDVTVQTDAAGVASIDLSSTEAGSFSFSAALGADQIDSDLTRDWSAGAAVVGSSSFSVSASPVVADGVAEHVLTASAADAFGNAVAGEEVSFVLPADVTYAGVSAGTWVSGASGTIVVETAASGVAEISVTSEVAGTYEVSGEIGAGELPGSPDEIEFVAGAVDAGASEWTVDPAGPVAAGETYTATVVARDAQGNPVAGAAVSLTLPAEVTVAGDGAATGVTNAAGEVSFVLTSTVKGTHDVTALVDGDPVGGSAAGTKGLEFTAAAADATLSVLTATTGVAEADGSTPHTATATIKDAYGNPVGAGVDVTFTFPAALLGDGSASPQTVATGATGEAELELTSETAGSYSVAASIDVAGTATEITDSPATVRFGAGSASAANSEWEITPASGTVAVGGTYTATVTVRDATNNPVADEEVTFSFPAGVNGTSVTSGTAVSDEDGIATFELTSEEAWTDFPISALIAGTEVDPDPISIQFVAGAMSLEMSTITASQSPIDVDLSVAETSTITVQLKDEFGNDLRDNTATVVIATSAGSVTVTSADGTDTGRYTAVLSGTPEDLVDWDPTDATLSFTVDAAAADQTATVRLQDVTPPAAPTVASTDGGVIVGSAEPFATVEVRDADTDAVVCETTADAGGAFTCGSSAQPVAAGEYGVVAIDRSGNESPSTPITILGPSAGDSTLTLTPAGPLTVGTEAANRYTATVQVNDTTGAAVAAGIDVVFTVPAGVNGNAVETEVTVQTDASGIAQLELSSETAGTFPITAALGAEEIDTADAVWSAGAAVVGSSSFSVSASPVVADGVAEHVLTASAADAFGNAVAGEEVSFVLPADVTYAGVSAGTWVSGASGTIVVETAASGVAEISVTSEVAGTYEVSGEIGAGELPGSPDEIEFVAGAVDAGASEWTVDPAGPVAAGETYTATVVARDAQGNPVAGAAVSLTLPAEVTVAGDGAATGVTNAAGEVSFVLTSTVKGTHDVTALVDGDPVGGSAAGTKGLEFTAAAADATLSVLTATTGVAEADGSTPHTATATIKDAYGNPVGAGVDVTFTFPAALLGDGSASPQTVATGATGEAELELTSETAGSYSVAASIDVAGTATEITDSPATVRFGAGSASAANSEWEITPASGTVAVGGTYTATVTVRDATNNPVADEEVTFSFPAGVNGTSVTSGTAVSDEDGIATFELTSEEAWTDFPISALIAGTEVDPDPISIQFVAGAMSLEMSTITASQSPIDVDLSVAETSTITVQLKDEFGNDLRDNTATVVIATSAGSVTVTSADGTDTGRYTAVLSGTPEDLVDWDPTDATLSFTVDAAAADQTATVRLQDVTPPAAPTVASTDGGVIVGSAEPFATVEVRDADTDAVVCETTADAGGAFTCGSSAQPVAAGEYGVVAIDRSGNESPSSPATVAKPPHVDTTTGGEVTGTGDPGNEIVIRDPETGETLCETTVQPDGTWSCGPVPPGSSEVVQIDPDGNESEPVEIIVAKPPHVDSTNGGEVTGTGEPGNEIEIRDPDTGDVICSTTVQPDGSWSCGPVPPGSSEVVQIDPDGNESEPVEITVAKPPHVDSTNGGEVTGTGEPGNEIVVRDPDTGAELCSTTVQPDGSWSCGPVPPGSSEVVQIDPDGNESEPVEITVAKPPHVDTTTGGEVTGTGEPGNEIEIRDPDTGDVICSTTVQPDGTWSCGPVPPGSSEVVQIDPDGNESEPVEITVAK